MGKVHGSLARAGKVRGQTPKVAKQDKKKKPRGRAHKRMQYNRRFVTAVIKGGVGIDVMQIEMASNKRKGSAALHEALHAFMLLLVLERSVDQTLQRSKHAPKADFANADWSSFMENCIWIFRFTLAVVVSSSSILF
ncbi:unnamed protein product [Dovyalis caffra]|uniref:40S ribosomal protein S30 n=1 Tax=Dovyalis caffra TaxID=77055 RepID=A0AAV1SEV5_9ROSI|nr:unnamed protein product [Dovyalis caffra]